MRVIGRDELKAKLDRRDPFRLIMTLGEAAYESKHIPGSTYVSDPRETEPVFEDLPPDSEIVVYCSNASCVASIAAYRRLEARGFTNVRRFPGGLQEWEAAGYPLESGRVSR